MVETWFAIFSVMLATYLVLDGRTLGASALRLFVSSTAADRSQVLDAIGPMWSWYEVWLVSTGGALLLAFPSVFAAAFSGYYLALFLILWLLVLRGIAIELGRHVTQPLWNTFWDCILAGSSTLLMLLIGVALGNVVRGAPLDAAGEFEMALFTDFRARGQVGLIDWYTLAAGLLAVVGLGAHGATFLAGRTSGAVRDRSRAAGRVLWCLTIVLVIAVALATRAVRPGLWSVIWTRPLCIAFLLIAAGAAVALFIGHRRERDGLAFAGSCALIAAVLGALAAGSFPVLLHSTLDEATSVSAYRAAASHHGLVIALVWWLLAAPLAIVWYVLATRSYRGRSGPSPSPTRADTPTERA